MGCRHYEHLLSNAGSIKRVLSKCNQCEVNCPEYSYKAPLQAALG
jgi:hypothetical protein